MKPFPISAILKFRSRRNRPQTLDKKMEHPPSFQSEPSSAEDRVGIEKLNFKCMRGAWFHPWCSAHSKMKGQSFPPTTENHVELENDNICTSCFSTQPK